MGQMVVRKIDDEALARFKARAKHEGVSAEALLRRMIEAEPRRMSREEALKRMDELRAMTPKSNVSSVELLRAMRDGNDDSH
jgi:plasmid stability protein